MFISKKKYNELLDRLNELESKTEGLSSEINEDFYSYTDPFTYQTIVIPTFKGELGAIREYLGLDIDHKIEKAREEKIGLVAVKKKKK